MEDFTTIEEIESWLAPLDYEAFWEAVAPFELILPGRAHCEAEIAGGIATREIVLAVLKRLARRDLIDLFNLYWQLQGESQSVH